MPTITRWRESGSVRVAASAGRLQPNPMTIGKKARPSRCMQRIALSITKAARARYPESSSNDRQMNMMPIGGMNVPIVTMPSMSPSTTSEWNQPSTVCGPNRLNTQSTPAVSHSRTVPSTQSWAGPANTVVAWNIAYMRARNTMTPRNGLSSTRSMRSETVTRSRACILSCESTCAAQSNRASALPSTHCGTSMS